MTYPPCTFPGCDRIGDGGRDLCPKHYMHERRAGNLAHYPMRKTGRPTGPAQKTRDRRAQHAAWCANNPDKVRAYRRAYRLYQKARENAYDD